MTWEKGPDVLLDAWARLDRKLPINLSIASPSLASARPEVRPLVESAKALAARDQRVHLLGSLAPDAARLALESWDVLVVPSRFPETGPLVVLEAQESKVVVVGSRRGGVAERVRDEVDGLLFPVGDASALRSALLRLVEDRPLLSRLRAAAPSPPDMKDAAKVMEGAYNRLIAERRLALA